MRTKSFIVIIAALSIAVVVYVALLNQDPSDYDDLVQQQQQVTESTQDTGSTGTESGSALDLEDLAKEGIGMPVPSNLTVARVQDGNYWFVGKDKDSGGVEVPFPPGRLPRPAPESLSPVNKNPGYVGADKCASCHEEIHESFCETAHFKTSSLATSDVTDGVFEAPGNVMKTGERALSFSMHQIDGKSSQRVHYSNWQFDVPMEIIFGSSKMAQTYLYWDQERLYQCNVTYLKDGDRWINSPGYIDGDAAYARPIPERCLDCHTTYFDFRGNRNEFTPESLVWGVSCERCHGPAESHVRHHTTNPDAKTAFDIAMPTDFPRVRQMAICGQCHAGSTTLKDGAFKFRPGDALYDHYNPADPGTDTLNSVHTSNQLTRLAQSECFKKSEMTCTECHDIHMNERGKLDLFSERCLSCHQTEECGMHEKTEFDLESNCIDCHMPSRPNDTLHLDSISGSVFPSLRDHKVQVDQKWSQHILESTGHSEE